MNPAFLQRNDLRLDYIRALAMSPDGQHAYAGRFVSDDQTRENLAVLDFNPDTGRCSPGGCIATATGHCPPRIQRRCDDRRRAQARSAGLNAAYAREDYAFARPSMVRRKLRRLELTAGAPRAKPGPNADPVWNTATDEAEKRLARQAERAVWSASRNV
jgi:hypothetical protein